MEARARRLGERPKTARHLEPPMHPAWRRRVCRIATLSFLGLALLLPAASASEDAQRPPDVVLIVMDTTRADHLSVYGYDRRTTPTLEEFAKESELFTRAWSTSSWTLPSHASLLTGKYVSGHGAHLRPDLDPDSTGDNPARLTEEATTLAEVLSARGYATAAFAGAGWLAPEFGLLQGYETKDAENMRDVSAEELTDRAIAWLDAQPADRPVHLLLNYFDAHDPYRPPKDFAIFPGAREPIPRIQKKGEELTPEQKAERVAEARRISRARYDSEILYIDHHIGRLLEALRKSGRYDRSLVIVTADHGEAFGEKDIAGHGAWLYEPLLRIPMIIHYPGGAKAGTRNDHPVSLVDVAPVVTEATGTELPGKIDGVPPGSRSLLLAEEVPNELLKKMTRGTPRSVDRDQIAGVEWPWKVILNVPGESELYDLQADPSESKNLADGQREEDLTRKVRETLDGLERLTPPAAKPMSPESRERLRALGYIE